MVLKLFKVVPGARIEQLMRSLGLTRPSARPTESVDRQRVRLAQQLDALAVIQGPR